MEEKWYSQGARRRDCSNCPEGERGLVRPMGWEEMEGEHLQQRTAYTAYKKGELFSATPNHRHLSGQQAQALQDRGEEKALPHEVKI